MLIISGSADNGIGGNVAKILGARFMESKTRTFDDGEPEVLLPKEIAGGSVVVVVQSTYAPQDKHLLELQLLADEIGQTAKEVVGVVPYLAFMREDGKFEGKNNAISSRTVLKSLESVGIGTLITVQPHKTETLLKFFGGKTIAIDATDALTSAVESRLDEPFVLTMGKGASSMGMRAAAILNCGSAHIDKERSTITGDIKVVRTPEEMLDGKDVLIPDDLISTGKSMAHAAKIAYSKGARSVTVAAAHLLMVEGAYETLKEAGIKEVYGTNTVPYSRAHVVDVAPEIALAIKNRIGMKRLRVS
jgi:ribose-phosphate pyrophosphokinase